MTLAQAKQGIEIGGKNAYKVVTYPAGGFGIAYHWINEDPALVVFPLDKALNHGTGAVWAMPLEAAHELVLPGTKGEGVNGRVLFEKAARAAAVIGREGDVFIARMIADALLANLDALCDMPPEPEWLALKRQLPTEGHALLFARDRKTGDMEQIAERDL